MYDNIEQDRTVCQLLRDVLDRYKGRIDPEVYDDMSYEMSRLNMELVNIGEGFRKGLNEISDACAVLEDSYNKRVIESIVDSLLVMKDYLNGGTYV